MFKIFAIFILTICLASNGIEGKNNLKDERACLMK
jgi:hypothetical protein